MDKSRSKGLSKVSSGCPRKYGNCVDPDCGRATCRKCEPYNRFGFRRFEITRRYRTVTFRTVYGLKIGNDIWVVHAFKKKSKTGIKTPKEDIDLIKSRIKQLKEQLK